MTRYAGPDAPEYPVAVITRDPAEIGENEVMVRPGAPVYGRRFVNYRIAEDIETMGEAHFEEWLRFHVLRRVVTR